jgi:fatty-acyl-CoA synthase
MTDERCPIDRLLDLRRPDGRVMTLRASGHETASWAELLDDARHRASQLEARGLGRGARVGLVAEASSATYATALAVLLTGGALMMLPDPPAPPLGAALTGHVRLLARAAALSAVIVEGQSSTDQGVPIISMESLIVGRGSSSYVQPLSLAGDEAILQGTSGSTGTPRVVRISAAAVEESIRAMSARLDITTEDVFVSWLPLYHDMGLFSMFLMPLVCGADLVSIPTSRFASAPGIWLQAISEFGGTISAAPDSAYALASTMLRTRRPYDLRSWRKAVNGAEPIVCSEFRRFGDAAIARGLSAKALTAAYGLAEATLAVALGDGGFRRDRVDYAALASGIAEPTDRDSAVDIALLGTPVDGTSVRIVDSVGQIVEDRTIGAIEVQTPSVMSGYLGDALATKAALNGSWLRTGDRGYLADGEVAVTGRLKDVVIKGGRNFDPHLIEEAANQVEGVRRGRVVAVCSHAPGERERLVVLVEWANAARDPRGDVRRAVLGRLGVAPDDVVLVERGFIHRTTSGKVMRRSTLEAAVADGTIGV